MTELKLSDLFKTKGRDFDYQERIASQEKLIERMESFPILEEYSKKFKDISHEAIVSTNFLEYFLRELTKICSKENIIIS